ncbi:uncharacterized protein PHALS_14779 [Plasmopara halstedii]|uniref:Uncharacterized protein n=1 Tax=Plasmopara halstedii TaxID=4781 RepID=A0A0P1ARE0_PLAHL|nr:uncharacterized protein PHALS_14779 [Plasmopara halstedii]CEG44152.1 hypothetical protein PHALS_14779 [Plasmopara halstedii]|eukprot:XP_024580521.1 hypothetical protein PHALS_14779 [Plasmopara halstedii]
MDASQKVALNNCSTDAAESATKPEKKNEKTRRSGHDKVNEGKVRKMRLVTGNLRINEARDDAAGLSISERK